MLANRMGFGQVPSASPETIGEHRIVQDAADLHGEGLSSCPPPGCSPVGHVDPLRAIVVETIALPMAIASTIFRRVPPRSQRGDDEPGSPNVRLHIVDEAGPP